MKRGRDSPLAASDTLEAMSTAPPVFSRDKGPGRVVRALVMVIAAIASVSLFASAFRRYADPSSPIHRYRTVAAPPRVFAIGVLHHNKASTPGEVLPPICIVNHERYESCGRSSCWRNTEGMLATQGTLHVTWSSTPTLFADHPTIELNSNFQVEPYLKGFSVTDRDRTQVWMARARKGHLGFELADRTNHRIVEGCLDDGEEVYVDGCVVPAESGGFMLSACDDRKSYSVIRGHDPQPSVDAEADKIAAYIAGAFAALFVMLAALVRPKGVLVDALVQRSGLAAAKMGWWWVSLILVPLMVLVNLVMANRPSTIDSFAFGKGGLVFALSAIIVWLVFAKGMLLRRRTMLSAIAPTRAIERSLLAKANGVCEIEVEARESSSEPLTSLLNGQRVVFTVAHVYETYRRGKSTGRLLHHVVRPRDTVRVTDESGEGVLDLKTAVLDVYHHSRSFKELPASLAKRIPPMTLHKAHVGFVIEERLIFEGERLYVLGDVTGMTLQATGEGGYRSVRGAPTLGGSGTPPLLVYSGDERGLVKTLDRDARTAHRLAIGSAGLAGLLSAIVTFLVSR